LDNKDFQQLYLKIQYDESPEVFINGTTRTRLRFFWSPNRPYVLQGFESANSPLWTFS